ncbi:purine-cytosine permease family protein [Nonomuraea sp. NPDC050540]|uniref:purine-cytosine permease family protein n=1 Tax=Nonomuraea sp. NPDC050540 TaxID=3364367 RepID=UPI00378CB637
MPKDVVKHDQLPSVSPGPAADQAEDRAGRVEGRGIDHVPEAERHGRPLELFPVWLGANVSYLYLLIGGSLPVIGLSVPQALLIVVLGNGFWLLVGYTATSGPSSGTPSTVVTRAIYGVRGNRPFSAGLSWITWVGYVGVNLAVTSLAGYALLESLGLSMSTLLRIVTAVAIGVATFAISVYGHATIVRCSGLFSLLLGGSMLLLGGFVAVEAQSVPSDFTPLQGGDLWAAMLAGLAVVAAGPLSYCNGADYSRYLPTGSSRRAVFGWTALGGWLPAVVLGTIGVFAGTVVDMTEPQVSMGELLPGWFYRVFLLTVVVGLITNNIITAYSAGLALQAVGVALSRATSVLVATALGEALCYILITTEFLTAFRNLLSLSVTFLAPALTIYAVDVWLRRNRYDGPALHDLRPGGPFWYRGGYNIAGIAALAAGTAAALVCVNTTVWQGPVASGLGGVDLAVLAGPMVSLAIYLTCGRGLRRESG